MRALRPTLGLVAIVAATALSGTAVAQDKYSEDVWQTILDMRISAVALNTFTKDLKHTLDPDREFESLSAVAREIEPTFGSRIAKRDAWGNEILFARFEYGYILVSKGEDGELADVIERGLEALRKQESIEEPGAEVPDTDDIIVNDDGYVLLHPMTAIERQRSRQLRAMADLRSLGTAIEEFAIDNNVYPPNTRGLIEVRHIRELIEPIYIRTMPTVDPWGHPFLVWSIPSGYMIVSMGSDGLLDEPYSGDDPTSGYSQAGPFFKEAAHTDIVFVNGQFVRWPEGISP